ncbi:TraR/DksA family transcriptional regulator (plasmid) [Halodesulfovibrio aestuarii]|uniref:Transcriptional regulator, TraR/DksA family n=1 Tax=Halodesulfovibrio aestuarii TaxID=126333 RepID=A0A8G2CD27_9BACT|nr:TraR/DksA family transcriptional regulator [Halodesulfovibrio aestuarii]SHJ72100.1 transcriptional regulator, TraR/DksA family [Halodesulfovibrio aestuarii]
MDVFDRASDVEQLSIKSAIAQAQANRPTGPSLTHCVECGNPIPEARQMAVPGCSLCIECQKEQEGTA